jgi:bifunctional UDP-N-acetylglucosamine pyrophosphorylase/glucosamine-1-phosphate N-acetyltransferase
MRRPRQVPAIVEHKDATEAQRAVARGLQWRDGRAGPAAQGAGWPAWTNRQRAGRVLPHRHRRLRDGRRCGRGGRSPASPTRCRWRASTARLQLAALERALQQRQGDALMADGRAAGRPGALDVRGTLACGQDVEIDVNCVFEGAVVRWAMECASAPNCVIANAQHRGRRGDSIPSPTSTGEKAGVTVGRCAGRALCPAAPRRSTRRRRAHRQLRRSEEFHPRATVPRPTTWPTWATPQWARASTTARVSITANYDGANKHRTVIEDDVHVGSNCVLVAPVTHRRGRHRRRVARSSARAPRPGRSRSRARRQTSVPNWPAAAEEAGLRRRAVARWTWQDRQRGSRTSLACTAKNALTLRTFASAVNRRCASAW